MNRTIQVALLAPWLLGGIAGTAWAAGDQPGGGGPSANVPPVGAGGSGPTDTNIGTGGRNELRDRSTAPPVFLAPGVGVGGAAGAGQGGGIAPAPGTKAPQRSAPNPKR